MLFRNTYNWNVLLLTLFLWEIDTSRPALGPVWLEGRLFRSRCGLLVSRIPRSRVVRRSKETTRRGSVWYLPSENQILSNCNSPLKNPSPSLFPIPKTISIYQKHRELKTWPNNISTAPQQDQPPPHLLPYFPPSRLNWTIATHLLPSFHSRRIFLALEQRPRILDPPLAVPSIHKNPQRQAPSLNMFLLNQPTTHSAT